MSHTASQESRILKHLRSGKSITPLEALSKFDCWALRSRISVLKSKGHKIDNIWMTTPTGKRVGKYVLRAKK